MLVATADQDSNKERKRDSERDTGRWRTEEEEMQGSRPGRVDGSRSADDTHSAGRLAEPRRARAALADVEARISRHRSPQLARPCGLQQSKEKCFIHL